MISALTIDGHDFTVSHEYDDSAGAPWENSDGHGPVSSYTNRRKRPGELVLIQTPNGSRRFYDYATAREQARRDGWGLHPSQLDALTARLGRLPTQRQIHHQAVMSDFDYLRGWCNDDWHYVGVIVTHTATGLSTSLWGIDSNAHTYLDEVARDLANQLLKEITTAATVETSTINSILASVARAAAGVPA